MVWAGLSDAEWRQHPLNRVRGWLVVIVIFLAIAGPLQGVMLAVGAAADYNTFISVFDDQVADWFEWAQLTVPTLGATVLLILIFGRVRLFPELYLALRGITYLVAIAGGAFAAWPVSWISAVKAGMILLEIGLTIHLFIGARPNVFFKRRVPADGRT
jgi:hypothetical protein